MSIAPPSTWSLEVVRGLEVGHVYPVGPGRCLLGNDLNGEVGISLGPLEGSSPRKMAPKQAELLADGNTLTLRDLDSPGGTFVNRQRILPGQSRSLQHGDVIQLGSVQMKIVTNALGSISQTLKPAPLAARIGPLPSPYTLAMGTTCRTWDDFVTVSAQHWQALREELVAGKIGAFLHAISRDDLQPPAPGSNSEDERLDDWLGGLPVSKALEPDLEVHPLVVRIRAVEGGGLTRSTIVVTNTGYRLLRSTLRIEPTSAKWLRLLPPHDRGAFITAETTEVAVEVTIPEKLRSPLHATLVIDGNGGVRKVEFRLESPFKTEGPPQSAPVVADSIGRPVLDWLMALNPVTRALAGTASAFMMRGLIALGERLPIVGNASRPSLAGGALLFSVIGAALAGRYAIRNGEPHDLGSAAFAGGVVGVLTASIAVAACRTVEPLLGATTGGQSLTVWAVIGALAGLGSVAVVPYSTKPKGAT